MTKPAELWIDALEFTEKGGWKQDTQFVRLMGSGYLIAANVPGDFAARQALKFLADMDTDAFDLSMARMEMIRHILNLMKHSK